MPTKTRTTRTKVYDPNGSFLYEYDLDCESISYVNSARSPNGTYRSQNPCTHYKMTESANYLWADYYEFRNASQIGHVPNPDTITGQAFGKAHLGLEFQKNDNFELIPFLTDWDNTLASFADRFKAIQRGKRPKGVSYGEAKWGFLPLLSDLKSLMNSLKDISSRAAQELENLQGKRITRRFPFDFRGTDGYFDHEVAGILQISGYLSGDVNFPDKPEEFLLVLLDELGFHPDAATLWEITPLSFVADYFFDIGTFLQVAKPRGWFNPTFNFTGNYSVKAGCSLQGNGVLHKGFGGYYSVYLRGVYNNPNLGTRPQVEPDWYNLEADKVDEVATDLGYLYFSKQKPVRSKNVHIKRR